MQLRYLYFCKNVFGFCKKALSQILDLVLNTPLSILKTQKRGAFCFLQHIKLRSSVIKCSPFYQKQIAKRHIYAFLILQKQFQSVFKKVQKYKIAKKRSLGKIFKQCTMISWARVLKSKTFQKWLKTLEVFNMRCLTYSRLVFYCMG